MYVVERAWNKGKTKETDVSVKKISDTMKLKKIDNFANWRKQRSGSSCTNRKLKKNGDLAEMLGVILGDGYIGKHPRTEVLRIASNSGNSGFIYRYSGMVESIFNKKPSVKKRKSSNCTDIVIYQKKYCQKIGFKCWKKNSPQARFALMDRKI